MLVAFPSSFSNIQMKQEKISGLGRIDFSHIPGKSPILGGWSLCIAEKSVKKDAAFAFINWACGKELANYLTLLTGHSTIVHSVENDELVGLYPWLPLYKEVLKYAQPIFSPYIKGKKIIPQRKIDKILFNSVCSIVKGGVSVQEAIQNAQRELIELFNKYGYPQN